MVATAAIIITAIGLTMSEIVLPKLGLGYPYLEFENLAIFPTWLLMILSALYVHLILAKRAVKTINLVFLIIGVFGFIVIGFFGGILELSLAAVAIAVVASIVTVCRKVIENLYKNKTIA